MIAFMISLIACEPKTAPEVAAPVVVPVPEEVAPEPEVIPEPEPVKPSPNVDFNVKLSFSDGSVKEGHVVRLERSSDFYGMKEWLDKESKLSIYGEAGSTAKDLTWAELRNASISGKSKDISCIYESDWNPWLYICTMKTNSSMVDSSGGKWAIDSKYKWRLTFDDDSQTEFWLQNIRVMEQDDKEVELGMDNTQNHELYGKLQEELIVKTYVTKVEIK